MQPGRPISFSILRNIIIAGLLVSLTVSCNRVFVKNYPVNKPFVYETNINLTGNIPSDSAELLQLRLRNQLDDSLKVRSVRKLIAGGLFNRPVLDKPPVYDSTAADRSVIYMNALLVSFGYFKDTITYRATIDSSRQDQYRTTVTFDVKPGKPVPLDSITYNMREPELQQLADANKNSAIIKRGQPFAKGTISLELDRLTELYRNNGYLRFGRDLMQGLWDTIDVSLLRPTFDPTEQLEILEKLREQRENPRADLEIQLKPGIDPERLTKYYVGNITVYPDYNYNPSQDSIIDTASIAYRETILDGIRIRYRYYLFKSKLFPPNIYLYRDSLYDQRNYIKTIDRLNGIGAWGLASIEPVPRKGQDTVDFIIRLSPARKYSYSANLEASLNNNAIAGNLVGFSFNVNLQIRNIFKLADLSSTSLRYGVETGRDTIANVKFIQTRQVSFSQSFYFPRPLLIRKLLSRQMQQNASTLFTLNAATTERRELFNLVTVNSSWGYEFRWTRGNHNSTFLIRIPNFEYSSLKRKPLLDTLFRRNPALQYVFTDGFISSIIAGYTRSWGANSKSHIFRVNFETSGLAAGLIRSKFLDNNLYRFIKSDAEYIHKINYLKTVLVFRVFAGVGYEFNSTTNPNKRNNLPFFKQYFAGGPNSMRAWALRKLGPGSVIKDFALNPERYGDVQLEGNIEYRFPLGKPLGIKVNGAVFTDMGNIWFLKRAPGIGRDDAEVFNFNRLGTDLAIGTGVGLRVDFSFFVVRFDFSHKVKDPSPSPDKAHLQNKWFGYIEKDFFKGTQFQLGISYPFIL